MTNKFESLTNENSEPKIEEESKISIFQMLFHLIEPLLKCSNTLLPEIVDCHKNGKYRPISIKRILFYCYSVTICIRILFASLYSNNHEKYEFIGKYQHDQYVYWIGTIKANTNSTMLGYSIIPLISLTIYFDYLIYVRPNEYIWSLVYHLMLENSQDFFQLNSQFFTDLTNKWITNPIKSIRANARLLPTIWNAKKAQFSSEYLSHIPNLNPQVRIRTLIPQMMAVQQMYQSDPLVYKLLQYFQSKRFLLEKIKLANYYELLHTDKKECFTIGELAKVNMQTIIQIYVLYSSSLILKFTIISYT
ncbi:hypothetical protein BLOT_007453 [Blomia tropicalis]|nr:hypothetical protein BLOT_007453 [Blomia tropicalis]